MTEKRRRRKRLVGAREYAKTSVDQVAAYSGSIAVICLGIALLGLSLVMIRDGSDGYGDPFACFGGGVFSVCSLATLWYGKNLFHAATKIRPVVLITKHNAKYLPEVETLVRGSGLPPSYQQAELLRIVQTGQETSPEELLRATHGSKGNQA